MPEFSPGAPASFQCPKTRFTGLLVILKSPFGINVSVVHLCVTLQYWQTVQGVPFSSWVDFSIHVPDQNRLRNWMGFYNWNVSMKNNSEKT